MRFCLCCLLPHFLRLYFHFDLCVCVTHVHTIAKEAWRWARIVGNRTPRPWKPPNIGVGKHTCFLYKSSKHSYCWVTSPVPLLHSKVPGFAKVDIQMLPVSYFPLENTQVASAHSERLLGLSISSHTYTQSTHFLSYIAVQSKTYEHHLHFTHEETESLKIKFDPSSTAGRHGAGRCG